MRLTARQVCACGLHSYTHMNMNQSPLGQAAVAPRATHVGRGARSALRPQVRARQQARVGGVGATRSTDRAALYAAARDAVPAPQEEVRLAGDAGLQQQCKRGGMAASGGAPPAPCGLTPAAPALHISWAKFHLVIAAPRLAVAACAGTASPGFAAEAGAWGALWRGG